VSPAGSGRLWIGLGVAALLGATDWRWGSARLPTRTRSCRLPCVRSN